MRIRKYSDVMDATPSGGARARSEIARMASWNASNRTPKPSDRAQLRSTSAFSSSRLPFPQAWATSPVVPMRRKPKAQSR